MYLVLLVVCAILFCIIYMYRREILLIISLYNAKSGPKDTIKFLENYSVITYYKGGVPYEIRIPHGPHGPHGPNTNRIGNKMILIQEIEGKVKEVDITHRHEIPYMLTARQLGGVKIVKRSMGEDVADFGIDEIPKL